MLRKIFLIIFLMFINFITCIFDSSQYLEPLEIKLVLQNDTVPPYPELKFAASSQLVDSSIDFNFFPPASASYYLYLNNSKDTISLVFTEMLEENTKYLIKLKTPLYSIYGAKLSANKDSFYFFTGFKEHEPNNGFLTSDTIKSYRIYGIISSANDTDVFYIMRPVKMLYLACFESRDTFLIFDSLGNSVYAYSLGKIKDTIFLPDLAIFPLYIKIFSYLKGVTGKYFICPINKEN